MKLSIVTSLYRSAGFLSEFHARVSAAARVVAGEDYEIILVNDGSPDNSLEVACALALADDKTVVLDLSRNFGHHPAFWAGMHQARGELSFLIDCDLEVDPGVLPQFVERLEETKADVVYGVQQKRVGTAGRRIGGHLFWRIFSMFSEVDVPADIMTERLLTRRYLDALLTMPDRNLFLAGMYYWPGFHQEPLPLTKTPRKGAASYTLFDRFKLLVEAISSFSSAPLKVIFWLGLLIFLLTSSYSTLLFLRKILFPETITNGFTFLALVSLFGNGLILMALGVIGLYLHRMFRQVQGRPVFIVREVHSKHRGESNERARDRRPGQVRGGL